MALPFRDGDVVWNVILLKLLWRLAFEVFQTRNILAQWVILGVEHGIPLLLDRSFLLGQALSHERAISTESIIPISIRITKLTIPRRLLRPSQSILTLLLQNSIVDMPLIIQNFVLLR